MKIVLAFASLLSLTATAFQIGLARPAAHPKLKNFAEDVQSKLLQVRLDIGQRASQDRLSLQGPVVKFMDSVAKAIPLPVATDPYSYLSSGSKDLEVIKEGYVVDLNGMRNIPFKDGCWEMSWREGDQTGRLACAFDLPEPIKRNGVTIPACQVLLSFRVWTKDSLVLEQAKKKEVMETKQELMLEKEAAVEKMQASNNPLMKLFLYREAAAAVEKMIMLTPVSHIPQDGEVLELANGLLMAKEGNLYTSTGPFNWGKKPLGTALISAVDPGKVN